MEPVDSDDLPVSPVRAALPRLLSFAKDGSRLLRCLGAVGPLQALLISRLVESLPAKSLPLVAVVADEQSARALRKDLQFFLHRGQSSDDPAASDPVIGLPELDVTPWDDASPERAAVLSRMSTLFRLSQGSLLSAQVVVASVDALARKVVPREAFADLVDIIAAEEELSAAWSVLFHQHGETNRAVFEFRLRIAALAHMGRLPGVKRPAIATPIPREDGTATVLLDSGANVDCKSEYLVQFAIMGEVYSREIMGVINPKIGLISNGEEDTKGNELTLSALHRLKKLPYDFVGNVEGRDIFTGDVDVIVSDGFTGNVILKTSEGLVEAIMGLLKTELGQTILTQTGAILSRQAFRSVKKRLDYSEFGGAPLLGCKQICVICHGSSTPKAIRNAIRVAKEFYKENLSERIESEISEMTLI